MAIIDSVKLPDNSTYEVADNHSGYQKETLTTPITINGTQKTNVEGALGGLNDYGNALADNLAANENVYGAKNRNVYPYKDTTKTENGVTFTDNGNGTITVSAASYPYTVSSDTTFYCSNFLDNEFKAGTWTLNGSPVVSDDVFVGYVVHYGGEYLSYLDKGQEVTFTQAVDTDDVAIVITLKSGYVLAGELLFKPMIRDARIKDPTFAPYAETNLQLTQNKAERNDLSTIRATGSTNTTGAQIDAGTFFYLNGSFCKALTNIAVNATFTLNTNFEVATVGGELENKLNLVKVAESASGTDTYKNKLNALYSAFNGLSELEKINSFIASYGGGIAPMKLTFSYDKRFAYSSRQAANLLSELYITLDSSDSVLCEAILNSSTNEISINDQSSNNTSRTLYLYTLR